MNDYVVYKHQSPSGKVYIGITRMKPENRWKGGWGYYTQAFYRAIQKYGWENFKHEILFSGLSQEVACAKEQELISEYDSVNPERGYNMTSGGEHYQQTKASRAKLSESLKAYYKAHPEARQRISESQIGKISSEEANGKRSASMKAYISTHPEAREMRGKAFRGKTRPRTTRLLMSQNSARSRAVVCLETGEEFKSAAEAARTIHTAASGITNALTGRAKTSGGLHWIYAADYHKGGTTNDPENDPAET